MPLNREALKGGIIELMDQMAKKEEPAHDEYADRLSQLIEAFVKSGTVTVATGIPVATSGSATAQTGMTTSTGNGTIS